MKPTDGVAGSSQLRGLVPELEVLERMLVDLPASSVHLLATPRHGADTLPIHGITFGPEQRNLPTLVLVGGVHGLERVGTQVLLSYLRTLEVTLTWDVATEHVLSQMRIVVVPLVNPIGMALGLRSNGRGVDLMRNAPIEAEQRSRWFELHRGHRLSPYLPWYRGRPGEGMEVEARALCEFIEDQCFQSEFCIVVDVHSGFLAGDRIWFPYAKSRQPFTRAPELMALSHLLAETHEHHVYTIEPQARNYPTHGDLWDYVYERHRASAGDRVLLPLTLELSSHPWYRKNPLQLVSRVGLFHPVKEHRLARTKRRHKTLFDFLTRAVLSHERWVPGSEAHRAALLREAEERWYEE